MAKRGRESGNPKAIPKAETYRHPEAESLLRPEVGTQPQFKKKKPPKTYRYDSSLSPALEWDGQNPAREMGEWLIGLIEQAAALPAPHNFPRPQEFKGEDGQVVATVRGLADAVEQLKRLGRPFLNWAGKAEQLSFDVPTLPLFIHERLSTKGIIETLKGHRRSKREQMDLFGDPQHSITDQVLKAYEYRDKWVNRLILGDSLVVMNSLLHYEGLGGQVQMIYMDPPYGIKFGSNFQPFVRKRDVKHNDDEDLTREPEMVKAYRDTWELGLHSYLTYLRDRLFLCRDLLTHTGSIFVQIGDENLHHVRELMDEVFGPPNFVALIAFAKGGAGLQAADRIASRIDYLVWYSKGGAAIKYRNIFEQRADDIAAGFDMLELTDGTRRKLTNEEKKQEQALPEGVRLFRSDSLTKPGPGAKYEIEFEGKLYNPGRRWWGMPKESLQKLISTRRAFVSGNTLRYVRYLDDFPLKAIGNIWDGLGGQRTLLTSCKQIQRLLRDA